MPKQVTEKIECLLCGQNEKALIADTLRFGKKANVCRCKNCGLVFLDQKSFDFPKDFYEKEYHQTYITHIEPDALNPAVYYEKMKKSQKIWADKFKKILKGDEAVLDVGCSTGHFIDMIKDKAKKVAGHELNIKEVNFCREKLGLDVSNKPLSERFKEKRFDYITMIYVLEHIAEPKSFLNELKKFLKPDGKFVILVPNIKDALVNFYNIPEFKAFYYCIEHLYYYSPDTMKCLFNEVGLSGSIETIQEYPIANHLNWSYRRSPSDTLASRKGVPDVELGKSVSPEAWEDLWGKFSKMYKDFLLHNGFGDRIWCVVGRNKNDI